MSNILDTMAVASTGMKAQATRLKHVAENIANADTPGYRRKTVAFEELKINNKNLGVKTGPVTLDKTELPEIYDPSHPLSNEDGNYLGSNVKVIYEVADSREAQRSYEANLQMFNQARKMATAALDLLRN